MGPLARFRGHTRLWWKFTSAPQASPAGAAAPRTTSAPRRRHGDGLLSRLEHVVDEQQAVLLVEES